jgi:hypothetical protein
MNRETLELMLLSTVACLALAFALVQENTVFAAVFALQTLFASTAALYLSEREP